MLRHVVAVVVLCAQPFSARAEDVWMVKSSGAVGCRELETLIALESGASSGTELPSGCVALYSGERLLGQADVGAGFSDHAKAQRGDGRFIFVPSRVLVADPGIGSLPDDRAE